MVDDIGGWFGLARKRKNSPNNTDSGKRINLGVTCKRRRRTTRSPKSLKSGPIRRLSRCTKLNDVVMREAETLNEEADEEAVLYKQLQTATKGRRHKGSSPSHATPSTIATAFEAGAEDLTGNNGASAIKSVKFPSFPLRNDAREPFRTQQSYTADGTPIDYVVTDGNIIDMEPGVVPPSGLLNMSTRAPEPERNNTTIPDSDVEDDLKMRDDNDPCCDILIESPPTPNAPRRTKSMNWLRFMLDNADEDLQGALATDDTIDINSDIYIEWIEWNKDGTLSTSDVVWTPPIALACRWNSPKIVKTLLDAGVDISVSNHLQQNLLVVLCAQPPLSRNVLMTLRDVYKPEFYNISRYQAGQTNLLLEQFIELRSQEMVLVAQLLLLHGVSPHQQDIYGKSAADYCSDFGHTLILKLFEVAVAQPMIYMGLSLSSRTQRRGLMRKSPTLDLDRCHTPPRRARPSVKVSTPRKTPLRCSTPERSAIRTPCPDDFSTPIIGSVTCPSSLPTGCPSTALNVKRRGRRLSSAPGPPKQVVDEVNDYSQPLIGI